MMQSRPESLDPLTLPLNGERLIEASAGTGKTFTIGLLYLRLLLGLGGEHAWRRPLSVEEILVVTFTEAATAELRGRIRDNIHQLRLACVRGRNFILSPEVVMRTAAVLETGGYRSDLPHSGDLEYWLRTAGSWDVGRINGPVQAFYRVHGSNMHQVDFAAAAVDLAHRLEAFRVLEDPRFPGKSPERLRQLRRAKHALSREAAQLGYTETAEGSLDAAVELRHFIESLHDVPGAVRRANSLQSRINRASNGRKQRADITASRYVRGQLDRIRWRLWAMTGIS